MSDFEFQIEASARGVFVFGYIDRGLLERSTSDIGLSLRTFRTLCGWYVKEEESIRTVGQLVKCRAEDLLQRIHFGKIALSEVRGALKRLGLKLKDD